MRPDAVLDAAGRALVSIARDEVSVPPRIAALTPTGLLGAMPGYVPGHGPAAKLVTVPADPRHADQVLVPRLVAGLHGAEHTATNDPWSGFSFIAGPTPG